MRTAPIIAKICLVSVMPNDPSTTIEELLRPILDICKDFGETTNIARPVICQDARNFAEQCKDTSDDGLEAAAAEFFMNYKLYWGTRALALMSEFHNLLYASDTTIDKEEE